MATQTKSVPQIAEPVFNGFPKEVMSANGAVTLFSGLVVITKATACVMTLAAPNVNDNRVLVFDSTTAAAHTLTITAGLRGAGAGADVLTWGGAIGDGITLYSYNGAWYVWPGTALNVTAG
jgi:hypothetical protein